jgi:LysM repeat protein
MEICPFLGLIEDAQTPALFPFERNCCYHVRKPAPLDPEHQSTFCLAAAYHQCQVFLSDPPSASLPVELRAPRAPANPRSGLLSRVVLFLLFAACVVFGLGLLYRQNQSRLSILFLPTRASPRPFSVTPAVVAAITGTPVALDTPTASVVPTATWTLTATLSIPPGVETPIGTSPQLLIHRVILGESLPLLAKRYGSSSEAIQKINYQMPVPLWEGWMVVIPLKTTEVSALPVFKTYQVKESSLTLEKVAQSLDVNLDLIQRYNPLQAEDVLPVDCWLLIPH